MGRAATGVGSLNGSANCALGIPDAKHFDYAYSMTLLTRSSLVVFAVIVAAFAAPKLGTARESFAAQGYRFGKLYDHIYEGRFQELDPQSVTLNLLFTNYIEQFSALCADALPADSRVFEHRMARWVNSDFGWPVRTDYYQWVVERTVRLKAEYYAPYEWSWTNIGPLLFREWQATGGDIPLTDAMTLVDRRAEAARDDLAKLLQTEQCASATTARFETNLFTALTDSNAGRTSGGYTASETAGSITWDYGRVLDACPPNAP